MSKGFKRYWRYMGVDKFRQKIWGWATGLSIQALFVQIQTELIGF